MKSLKIIIITIVLFLSTIPLRAQDELYRKYSGREGVTKIYISETMFSLFKGGDILEITAGAAQAINIGEIINNLTGLYILSSKNDSISKEMEHDFDLLIQEYQLELLMEIEEKSNIIKTYITRDGEIIKNFFMIVKDNNKSLTIMFFKGNIPQSELTKIINTI